MPPSSQTNNAESANRPPKRRPRLWIALIVITLACAWFTRFAYLRITLRPTPRPEYWRQKIQDLCSSPPSALTAQVAARIFANRPWETHPGIVTDPESGDRHGVDEILKGPWDESRPDFAVFSAVFDSTQYDEAAEHAERAIATGWETELTEYESYSWSHWFLAHARWAKDHNADMESTVRDWLNCLGLSRQIGRIPCVTEQFLASRIIKRTAREMICTAAESHSEIDARRLAVVIDEIIGPQENAVEFLAGERYLLYSRLESIFVREHGDWLDVSEAVQSIHDERGVSLSVSRIWNITSPLFSDLNSAKEEVDAWMNRLKTLATDDPPRFSPAWIDLDVSCDFDVLDGFPNHDWEYPEVSYCLRTYFETRCQLRAATAMLALAEFHRDRGHFPEQLEELVPEYLPRVPSDYTVRQPLQYHRVEDRYVLYSLGPDGRDSGGVEDSRPNLWMPTWDIVYSEITRNAKPNDDE